MERSSTRPIRESGLLVYRHVCKVCGVATRVAAVKWIYHKHGPDGHQRYCKNGCGWMIMQLCVTDQPECRWQGAVGSKMDEYTKPIAQQLPLELVNGKFKELEWKKPSSG